MDGWGGDTRLRPAHPIRLNAYPLGPGCTWRSSSQPQALPPMARYQIGWRALFFGPSCPSAATKSSRQLARRMSLSARPPFSGDGSVIDRSSRTGLGQGFLRLNGQGLEHEVFAVTFLDAHRRPIGYERLSAGTDPNIGVPPRGAKRSLEVGAVYVIVSHDHPSGTGTPSRSDEALSRP